MGHDPVTFSESSVPEQGPEETDHPEIVEDMDGFEG